MNERITTKIDDIPARQTAPFFEGETLEPYLKVDYSDRFSEDLENEAQSLLWTL